MTIHCNGLSYESCVYSQYYSLSQCIAICALILYNLIYSAIILHQIAGVGGRCTVACHLHSSLSRFQQVAAKIDSW